MIDPTAVQNHVHRKINRLNSRFSGYVGAPEIDEYINEALAVWTTNKASLPEVNSNRREELRQLEIKNNPVKFKNSGDRVIARLPSNFLKLLNQRGRASIKCDEDDCNNRLIKIRLVQSGEIEELLDDPNWEPSFGWGETIADEAHDGLHIWHNNKFKFDSITIDYFRKPEEVRTPSLMKEGYYTVGNTKYTKNQGLELDQVYQVNDITDLAALFILRDLSDGAEYQSQIDKILRTNTLYLN